MSLFEQLMGADYARLAPELQAFHRLQGGQLLLGEVQTEAPQGRAARLLAAALGSPLRATRGPLRFELRARPDRERWTRHFPGRPMQSELRAERGELVEQLGAARLRFALEVVDGRLQMRLLGLRFLGLPCPAWLRPELRAEERGADGCLHFDIEARLPGIGRVVRYQGHLRLPT